MIRLTLNAQSDPEIYLFDKSTVLIGAEPSLVDLVLENPDIQPIHLKITCVKGKFFLKNTANDPFTSLNGHPFGKKLLSTGDLINLQDTTLLFEALPPLITEIKSAKSEEKSPTPPEEKSCTPSSISHLRLPFHFPFEEEVEAFNEEELLRAASAPSSSTPPAEPTENKPNATHPEPPEKKKEYPLSLKDDYLKEWDDAPPSTPPLEEDQKEASHLYQAWKWILVFIFSIISLLGFTGSVIFFTLSDKTEAQETKAAQGVADIAMALTHAQLHHLKPPNLNWADAEFLKSNLATLLPDTPSYASQIDAQGQFHCSPYSLRIYTDSHLSHFLLIAQPAPNLLNWLIPQSLIVVDSELMELRALKDVRGLNRLLAHTDPLDGPNGKEITSLIKQEELINLTTLAAESGNQDFAPPKNLQWLRPGAENLIYNVPRYYRLGYHVVQQSLTLYTTKGSSHDVTTLQHETERLFSTLKQLVLYSDQGKKSAIIARQGLMLFAPPDKLLFGYLLFNAQGKIHQVYLLKEDEEPTLPPSTEGVVKEKELIALNSPTTTAIRQVEENKPGSLEIDTNHPIYIHLQSLMTARDNELRPLTLSLTQLIDRDLTVPRAQFQSEFQSLFHNYLMANIKHKQAIKKALDTLYHQYEDLSINQFISFIETLSLDQLIYQEEQSLTIVDENCRQNMKLLLTYIENAKSLSELDNLVDMASLWLNFDYMRDPQELIKYQNLLRNKMLEQLQSYLLSEKKYPLLRNDDKEILENILSQERLIKPEEKEFFLAEFDEILNANLIH